MSTRTRTQSTSMNIAGKILWMAVFTALVGLFVLTLGLIQAYGLVPMLLVGAIALTAGTIGVML